MASLSDHSVFALLLAGSLVVTAHFLLQRFLSRRRFARRHGCQPVANRYNKEPFLGLDSLLDTFRAFKQHKVLELGCEHFRTFGNTFLVKEMTRQVIATSEPENIKTILSLNFKDYGIEHRLNSFHPLLGTGIFVSDGYDWASSRALVRPNFTRSQVADLTSFENLIQDLFSILPRDGKTVVDLQDLFFRYTIDSATDFLFGTSVGSLKMTTAEHEFAHAFNYAQEAITRRGLLGPFSFLWRDRKADACFRFCREYAQRFVEDAIKAVQHEEQPPKDDVRREKRYIFSHELARHTSDKRRILDEILNVLLAGRDTTASLLSNLFFMLAKNPAMWARIRQEVSVLHGEKPTYDELRNLKYVQCCLNESLRLHPVVPRNGRIAIRDTVLPLGGGKDGLSPVFVPKGTLVGYHVHVMHRRVDFYGPDAEEFRPERWEKGQLQPRWEYLPFNGGPRICVGQRYALTEVGYVLVRMAQEFEILQSRDPGPWEESLTLTVCSRNGTKVSLTPANKP
ncbi:hypothetical protein HIM_06159 [Hirsutella minnesotensis 3608]|uniref:Cytochrome P450 alkane hydroxylase n=1 Tax=Hirsutella minnesotensis 3608 TaxID=1043627 RepID=A0A0F7ZUB3_9HYPO|nr:hypothetical protein HIM_06159 [Hirsutella minnesotensis 3608]